MEQAIAVANPASPARPATARRKVVLLTYQFPPIGAAGSLRMLSFARFLPEYGWDPVVVTVGQMGIAYEDSSLLGRLDESATIFRWFTPLAGSFALRKKSPSRASPGSGSPSGAQQLSAAGSGTGGTPRRRSRLKPLARRIVDDYLAVPDYAVGWSIAAGIRAGNWMKANGVSIFVTTSPPHSTLLAGFLARAASGAAWVADMRDPWPTLAFGKAETFRWKVTGAICSTAVHSADRILANTGRFAELLHADPRIPPGRVEVLPNGYDADEIGKARAVASRGSPNGPFVVVHAGTLYKGLRQPVEVLDAMARVNRLRPGGRSVHLVLPGDSAYHHDRDLSRAIQERGLEGQVEFPGYVPHEEALAIEAAADLLLLIQGGPFHLQVPSKAYEYLAIGRPILAVTSAGATADLVRSSPVGRVVAPGDVEGLTACLLERLDSPSAVDPSDPPPGVYSRKDLTGKLARILDTTLAASRR